MTSTDNWEGGGCSESESRRAITIPTYCKLKSSGDILESLSDKFEQGANIQVSLNGQAKASRYILEALNPK